MRPLFPVSPFIKLVALLALLSACASPTTQPVSLEQTHPKLFDDHFIASDGYRLPFLKKISPKSPKAVVIALHGFNDYSRAFEGFCDYLSGKNIVCIAYDQRGFGNTEHRGLWPAKGLLESDINQLVGLVEQRYPKTPIYLAGESMGGAVLLSAMADDQLAKRDAIAGLALFAPAIWGRDTQPWYQRWGLSLAVRIAPSWKPTGESLEIVATDNIEALREMSRDELIIKETRIDTIFGLTNLMDKALQASQQTPGSVLIMYGEKDEVIPIEPTCKMLATMADASVDYTFRLYPNGYHMLTRDLQAEKVFDEFYDWVASKQSKPESMDINLLCAK
jgi:alpha-beta hydrolase superfamily lysophospholipase